jgi:signal transduction histidine kinase
MPGTGLPTEAPRPPWTYRVTARQWLAIDVAASVLAMLVIAFGLRVWHGPHFVMPTAGVAGASVAATLPVAVRRLWALPVLAVVTVAVAALTAVGQAPLTSDLMLGMASYMAAVQLSWVTAIVALAGAEAVIFAGLLTGAATAHNQNVMLHSILACAAMWFVGAGVRERRRYQAGLAEQQAQRKQAEADRGRRALAEERLRIARDLHDVLAHSLSVVTVQAGVGRKVGAARPAEALRALRCVEEASRGALDELRQMLCLLRSDDEPGETRPAAVDLAGPALVPALSPAPGLADLDNLAATVRTAGIPVRVDVTGDVTGVPPAAALTVYRITQEALTNVVRHAPGAEATVRVGIDPAGLRIRVTDTGRDPWSGTAGLANGDGAARNGMGGHGIAGMRERAAAFGGTLEASPLPGGGFQVAAFLPSPPAAAGRVA